MLQSKNVVLLLVLQARSLQCKKRSCVVCRVFQGNRHISAHPKVPPFAFSFRRLIKKKLYKYIKRSYAVWRRYGV